MIDQTIPEGHLNGMMPGHNLEFAENVTHMAFGGIDADGQLI